MGEQNMAERVHNAQGALVRVGWITNHSSGSAAGLRSRMAGRAASIVRLLVMAAPLLAAAPLHAQYVCDVNALRVGGNRGTCGLSPDGCCFADLDGNGVVNAADRGQIGDAIGTIDFDLLCLLDLNGDGVVNPADRGYVSSNFGLCYDLPDFQDGSGLNGGVPDPRYPHDPVDCTGNQPPVANAGPDLSAGTNQPVSFTAAQSTDSDGQVTHSWWDFGDGASTGWIPGTSTQHTFTQAGTFAVHVWVMDDCEAFSADDSLSVVVSGAVDPCASNQPPVANAGPDKSGRTCDTINFSGSGSTDPNGNGTIQTYHWNFGNGQSATGLNVSHQYTTAGARTVTLTVTDNCGVARQDTAIVTIAANQLPVANAGPDRSSVPGQSVAFSAAGSSDPDGTIVSYAWSFGDSQSGSGASVNHTYASVGVYTATLTVTDDCGATKQDTARITVVDPCSPDINSPPVANAGGNRTANTGQSLSFSGAASSDADGTIVNYAWNFGDNQTASGSSVSHAWASAGTFNVTLTVTDNCGAQHSTGVQVVVSSVQTGPPSAEFTWSPLTPQKGDLVTFQSSAGPGSLQFALWEFSDDLSQVMAFTATHRFMTAGTFDVTLMAWDMEGEYYEKTVPVQVVDGLKVRTSPPVLMRTHAQDVALSPNGFAFVGNPTQGVVAVDIQDPSKPQPVATHEAPGTLNGIQVALSGNVLYYLTSSPDGATLASLDVSVPSAPVLLHSRVVPGVNAPTDLVIRGNYGYASNNSGVGSFSIFNVASPTALQVVGTFPLPSSSYGVAESAGRLYLATSTGLAIYDVTIPQAPIALSFLPLTQPGRSVEVSGSYAFVGTNTEGGQARLEVVNVSNPLLPFVARTVAFGGSAQDVALSGNYAYVSGGGGGLTVVNIASPTNASLAGQLSLGGAEYGLAVSGTKAWICGQQALLAVNVASPSAPTAFGELRMSYETRASCHVGDAVWAAANPNVLSTIDVSDPDSPRVLLTTAPGVVYGLAGSSDGQLVAAAAGSTGVLLFDATQPASQPMLGSYVGYGATSVIFVGDYVYAGGTGGIRVIDAINPANPGLVGSFGTNLPVIGFALSGTTLYAAGLSGGVHVYDVATPAAPVFVRTVSTYGPALALDAGDGLLAVSESNGDIELFSLASPSNPQWLSRLDLAAINTASGVAIDGSRAYFSLERRVYEIDITVPTSPVVTESLSLDQGAGSLAVWGSQLFVGVHNRVVMVLDR
jgi:hypothetical protein